MILPIFAIFVTISLTHARVTPSPPFDLSNDIAKMLNTAKANVANRSSDVEKTLTSEAKDVLDGKKRFDIRDMWKTIVIGMKKSLEEVRDDAKKQAEDIEGNAINDTTKGIADAVDYAKSRVQKVLQDLRNETENASTPPDSTNGPPE